MGSTAEHQCLVNSILVKYGALPQLRIWKNATGSAQVNGRYLKFGLIGSSDIIGISYRGQFLAIECKTGSAKQSPQQILFQKMIEKFGGIYVLARKVEDVQLLVDSIS